MDGAEALHGQLKIDGVFKNLKFARSEFMAVNQKYLAKPHIIKALLLSYFYLF